MKKALLIIAPIGYQDIEFDGTQRGLIDADFSVVTASTERGACTGKFGRVEEASVALKDVDVSDYDRIAFIGGPGAEALRDDVYALAIAKAAAESDMVIGAICIAPTILAAAGVLQGKRATCFMNNDGYEAEYLEEHGAEFIHEDIVVDGHIVTANGPKASEEFGKTFAALQY